MEDEQSGGPQLEEEVMTRSTTTAPLGEVLGELRSVFAAPTSERLEELYHRLEWTDSGQLEDVRIRTWCAEKVRRVLPGRFKAFLSAYFAHQPPEEIAERYKLDPTVFPLAWGNTARTWCLWSDGLWTSDTCGLEVCFQLEWARMSEDVRAELDAACAVTPRISSDLLAELARVERLEWIDAPGSRVRRARAFMRDGSERVFLADSRDRRGEGGRAVPAYWLELMKHRPL